MYCCICCSSLFFVVVASLPLLNCCIPSTLIVVPLSSQDYSTICGESSDNKHNITTDPINCSPYISHPQHFGRNVSCFLCFYLFSCLFLQYLISSQILCYFLSVILPLSCTFSVIFSLVWQILPYHTMSHPQCFIRKVCCFCVSTCFYCLLFLQYLIPLQNVIFVFLHHWHRSLVFFVFSAVLSLVWPSPSLPDNRCVAFIPILVHSFLFWSNPSRLFFSSFIFLLAF